MSIAVLMDYCYLEEKLMNILNLSHYYFPEKISSSHLTEDLEDAYIEAGLDFIIHAPIPTRGISKKTYNEYKRKKEYTLKDGHIKVNRFYMFREAKNPILRTVRYIMSNFIQYQKGCIEKDVDIIIAASTPPTQGILCSLVREKISKKRGEHIPFLYSLQDVFPESLVTAGLTKKGSLLWNIGRKMESYIYHHADIIVVISQDIKENILAKGVPENKIRVVRNWIDTKAVHPVRSEDNGLIRELGLRRDTFKVVYAGNLGRAQGVQVIIDVAEKLKNKQRIEFIIFGNGVEEEKLKCRIAKKRLSNINIYPLQASERVSEVYSLGDVCVVTCKKGAGKGAFPSKTVSIMATATPVIAAFDEDSELCKTIIQHECGIVLEPENSDKLADAILELAWDEKRIINMGKKGRSLVEREFSKRKCTSDYVDIVKELIGKEKRSKN